MLRRQFQLPSKLYDCTDYDKEKLTQKILERGRVLGIYRKGGTSYRRMSKDFVERVTNKAFQDNQKFQQKMIYSTIKGKAYTLKLGCRDALPSLQKGENFLSEKYGRRRAPNQKSHKSILELTQNKQKNHSKTARIIFDLSQKHIDIDNNYNFSLSKAKLRRKVHSQLPQNVLSEIKNDM